MGLKTKGNNKGDALSRYFKDLNESDIDSDSDENNDNSEAEETKSVGIKSQEAEANNPSVSSKDDSSTTDSSPAQNSSPSNSKGPSLQKLPSAHDCFGNKTNPSFLKLHQKREINWDHSTHLKVLGDDESPVIDYKSNAVPPPASYEPVTDSSIKVVDSQGNKRKSEAENSEEQRISSKTCRLEGGATHKTETEDS